MRITVVGNQKGGIGKTTTAMALASLYKQHGERTLLIDTDPQGNSSHTYGAAIEGAATLYDVIMDEERTDIHEAIQHLPIGDIIASDPLLRNGDKILSGEPDGFFRLADALAQIESEYDEVVIDTAPSINMILYNCLTAATDLIIPLGADQYSIAGLSQLHETVSAIRRRQNRSLKIDGLLLVKYKERTHLGKAAKEALEHDAGMIGTTLFRTWIRECTKCGEAQAAKEDLFSYAPYCTTAEDYRSFFGELQEMYKHQD